MNVKPLLVFAHTEFDQELCQCQHPGAICEHERNPAFYAGTQAFSTIALIRDRLRRPIIEIEGEILLSHTVKSTRVGSCCRERLHSRFGSGPVWVLVESRANRMLRNGSSLRSYNYLAGRNGSGHCWDATTPRDIPVGSSSRCSAAREVILPRCTLTGGSHRTIDPMP